MTLDSLPDLDTSGLCLVKTLFTALTCWPDRNTALRDDGRTSTRWFDALEWRHHPCLGPDRGGTSVLAQQPGDRRDQIGRFEGLGDVHLEPGRQGSRPIFGPSVGGHGQGRNGPPALGFQGSKLLDQRVSVDIPQSDVADQDVWVPLLHLLECLLGAPG